MPYLDGTRTSTLAADHTQDVQVRIVNPFAVLPPELQYPDKHTSFTIAGHLGFSASLSITTNTTGSIGNPWSWELRASITVNNGHGVTTSNYVVLNSGTEASATLYVDASATCAGALSCSVGTDKLWDITETAFPTLTPPTLIPPYTTYDWYEKSTVGSTATCSLSAGGSTITATGAVGASRQTAQYNATLGADGFVIGNQAHNFSVSNVTVNGTSVYDVSYSQTNNAQSCTEWTLALHGDEDAFGVYLQADGSISTTSTLTRTVSTFGRIRAWDGAYPDALDVVITGYDGGTRSVTASSGSWSGSDTFNNYSVATSLTDPADGTETQSASLNDVPAYISAQIDGADLTTAGDATGSDYQRVLFRGWRFSGWTLTDTNNRAISGTGNDRLYAPLEGMSGYRYLDVQVKAQSGTNVAGVIELTDYHGNTKRWNVTAATTSYATVTLDLCSPDYHSLGALPATDDKDNPYPRKNTSSSSYAGSESVDSAYWGVTSCQRLRVYSGAVDIGTTTLKYTNTDSTYVPDYVSASFERKTPAIVAEADTTTYYYGRRFWQQDRDGRNEEESDCYWQKTVGGATGVTSYSAAMLTITDLATQINISDDSIVRHPGYTATNSVAYPGSGTCSVSQPPLGNCYLNGETGYSTWLYGGGILATPNATSGTDFAYGHQITASSVTAQTLFDRINGNFPPDLYDPFDVNGGTDAALYLPAGSLLRGIGHGALLDIAGDPLTTGTVDILVASTLANRGTDSTPDADGRYYTGSPWGLGEVNHDISYSTADIGLLPLHTSHRHRGWFREQELAGVCVSADVGPNQRMCYAVIESGFVALHHADGPNGTNWVMTVTSIEANCVHIAYDPTSATGRMYILTEETSNAIKMYYTDDEGVSVSVAVTVTSTGDDVSVAIAPTGKRIVVWHHNNDLYRAVYDPQGNVITAASIIVTGGVNNGKTAVTWRLGVWYAYYRDGGSSLVQISSVDDGETWA
jgi:hypothetical protein